MDREGRDRQAGMTDDEERKKEEQKDAMCTKKIASYRHLPFPKSAILTVIFSWKLGSFHESWLLLVPLALELSVSPECVEGMATGTVAEVPAACDPEAIDEPGARGQ
jgi:hypothetical protein